jgi:membrane protease YdiL (CAAX protease family)
MEAVQTSPLPDTCQTSLQPNSFDQITRRAASGQVSRTAPWWILPLRSVLFLLTQSLVALILSLTGQTHPWQASIPWWPVYLILANLVTLTILNTLCCREGGIRLVDLWNFSRRDLKRDVVFFLLLGVISIPVGAVGFIGAQYLLYGSKMPEYVGALPMWAAWLSLLVMPVSIAVVELPTYLGYSMQRLEVLTGRRWLAMLLPVFWLALQHSALPLMFDLRFIIYRFLSMAPVALFVGIAFLHTRRLFPLMIVHFLLDLMLGLSVFSMSLGR